MTIKEVRQEAKYQASARIRELARGVYKNSGRPKYCLVCNYDAHYEVCHIIGISEFPEDTLVSVVNHIDNLIAMCRNHHWELDNGILKL